MIISDDLPPQQQLFYQEFRYSMNKDEQIYVQFGDYVMLRLEHLRGNVASQGCANPNVYLQINPEAHQECFTRNKRDFVFQIRPKLNYDARRDYEGALAFYQKTFVDQDDGEPGKAEGGGPSPSKKAGRGGGEEEDEGSDPEDHVSQTSFFGAPPVVRPLSQQMKKDRDHYKKKVQALERKMRDEEVQNQKNFLLRMGEYVEYGNEIQLLHVDTASFVQGARACADEDNSCNKVELVTYGTKDVYFKTLGGFKYKQEGDRIHYNDQIVLQNVSYGMYLHVTERFLKIDGLDGKVPEALATGMKKICPKDNDRRVPPNMYVPQCEVNLSNTKSKFMIQIYRYYNEDPDGYFVKGGDVVRLVHSEKGGFVHSDDKDFTNDGLAEVYIWNYKGKPSDPEAKSSSSLFEVELASPLPDHSKKVTEPTKAGGSAEKGSKLERPGQVFQFSPPIGEKTAVLSQAHTQDIQYRLRHLNTGRLVVDQQIEMNGIKMRSLSLAPHLVSKNLVDLSDRLIEGVQAGLNDMNKYENYDLEDKTEKSPQTYEDLDVRSRFRLISTSPSLDDRIKCSSCIQIQHVSSEMYLSYQTSQAPLVQANVPAHGELGQFADKNAASAHATMREEQLIAILQKSKAKGESSEVVEEKYYLPVDDDDIQCGTRDAIDLKATRSNENAFFINPEQKSVLQNILFIQTANNILRKYLPTICSRTLEISKEKQTKIQEVMQRIEKFLAGDTEGGILQDEQILSTMFSKEINDQHTTQQKNLRMRQKLMRELYIVETLVQQLFLPFTDESKGEKHRQGDYNLADIRGTDNITAICQRSYKLLTNISLNYYQNELYVSQWLNLYFFHAMSTGGLNNIGAEDTIIALVDNNKKLLEMQITPAIIDQFITLCIQQDRERKLIELLKAICSCHGDPVRANQNDIVTFMLEVEESRTALMMPVRMRNEGVTDVQYHTPTGAIEWIPIHDYRKLKRRAYGYFLSMIDICAELTLGRNNKAHKVLQDMYQFDHVKSIIQTRELPYELRALFLRILLHMHMNRDPLEPLQIPASTGVWAELPQFMPDQFADLKNLDYPIKQAKIQVPGSLTVIKTFVEQYLHETQGVQNIIEVGKNMMTAEVLKIIQFMLNHGFYTDLEELKLVALPMINMLDGSNDSYSSGEEQQKDKHVDDFLSCNRYFSNGNNDIIVECKTLICQNLLLISQLEIDGKVQIFLSKFKADLDRLMMQKQISFADPNLAGKKEEAEEKKPRGCFRNFRIPQMQSKVGAEKAPRLTSDAITSMNIKFLNEIASVCNFESESQDAYISVLFDLLLYQYPNLAKGVFELLVRLFTRKRTLLENIMKIQMLENPRSIIVLNQVKSCHSELNRYIEDTEQWINKSNQDSAVVKVRVAQIFAFFAEICLMQKRKRSEDDYDSASEEEEEVEDSINQEPENEAVPDSKSKAQSSVSKQDFILFDQKEKKSNKENQRLLGSFGIENLALFFIKYRVDRDSISDPLNQQLIHQCYNFLVMYVKDNFQNQVKVHNNLEIFLKDLDKNSLICLLIYEMFKGNKKFLTLNVTKILRVIILSAEEAALHSSKKCLYLKLLEVFCKFEDKLVRPNQQEIVVNFTRDVSKNNLIYLFSAEGLPHLVRLLQACLKKDDVPAKAPEEGAELVDLLQTAEASSQSANMSIEVFNVMVCLNLMSVCCEGKSDMAEIRCQNDIVNVQTALTLYQNAGKLWPFKSTVLKYIMHCYLDSGNEQLFSRQHNPKNIESLLAIIELIKDDMVVILDEWNKQENDCRIIFPDGARSSFLKESKIHALGCVTSFFKAFLRNKKVESTVGIDMFPVYHEITIKIARMYYLTPTAAFKNNAMDVLQFINTSEKYSHLLQNVQHPANQNIYVESKKKGSGGGMDAETGQKTTLLSASLVQLAYSEDMIEQKEREFEALVLWVTNIASRIDLIMSNAANGGSAASFRNVNYSTIVSAFMALLDSKCMDKDLHITGLTLLRKIVEVENKDLVTPAADWGAEDWDQYAKIVQNKQNQLVEIGCIDFLCKHIQNVEDDEILEQTFLVCITLLLGGNQKSQDAFYTYFLTQDVDNDIMIKLRRLLVEQFDLTKKFIGEQNAQLAQSYKNKIRQDYEQNKREKLQQRKDEGIAESVEVGKPDASGEDENLLTIEEEEMPEDESGANPGPPKGKPVDEMFLVNQTKIQSIQRCKRMLRFLQLLAEGHHTEMQNYLREQLLANGVPSQRSFDFISYLAGMLSLYEKSYINVNTCDLGAQLFDTLIELVQGPCRMNQRRLVEAKVIDCCRDLIQQGQQSKTEIKMKGFTTHAKEEQLDALKMQATNLLNSLIEGAADHDIYQKLATSFDDFLILTKRMQYVYERFLTEVLGVGTAPAADAKARETRVDLIRGSLNKDSFRNNVKEGFDIFNLINQLALSLPEVLDALSDFTKSEAYQFFRHNTGNVEILKDDEIMTICFPVQPVSRFLTEKSRDDFRRTCSRASNQHKIIDLVAKIPEFIDEMEHLELRSHDYFQITPGKLLLARDVSTYIAISVSFIVIGFYKYERLEKANGASDYTSFIPVWPARAIYYLGLTQLVSSMGLLVGFCLNRINIIVKSGWRKRTEQNKERLKDEVKFVLSPCEPPFGEIKAKDLPMQAARVLLLTEGPYHQAFIDDKTKKMNFVYTALDFEFRWISLSFLMQNGTFIFNLMYLAFSLQGLFQSPIFYSFHLLDMINRFPQLQNVIKSVTKNGFQLCMTAMLGSIFIYIYSTIGFIFLYDTFYNDDIHAGLLNSKGDSICMSMMHCFLSELNYGLRGGGGIGDFLPTQTAVPENRQGFYFRAIYDLSFFLLIITILLNIIFGIIIDTFAQLRDDKQQTDNDMRDFCFICNIEKQQFDREMEGGFEAHKLLDHDEWQYVSFIIHIKSIDPCDLNGTESYVLELFEGSEITWFPMGRSRRIDLQAQLGEERRAALQKLQGSLAGPAEEGGVSGDPLIGIPDVLGKLEERVNDLDKRFQNA